MLAGSVVALAGSVVGNRYTRRRRDIPRAWWLRFWRSRAGSWVGRLAVFGLGGRPRLKPRLGYLSLKRQRLPRRFGDSQSAERQLQPSFLPEGAEQERSPAHADVVGSMDQAVGEGEG
jgi:hypothetical protein